MDVYFSCALTGGRQDQPVYAALVQHLRDLGHRVLTAHLAEPGVMAQDALLDAAAVYARDLAWLEACDALVAEVTTPSHGVGFELAHARTLGKPVLCLHRAGTRVSKMLTGCPDFSLGSYADPAEAQALAGRFLAGLARA